MAWSGYIGLGTISAGVFTEISPTAYARLPFSFGAPAGGKVAGIGGAVSFATVTGGTAWTHDGYGLFAASSGGSPVLVYGHSAAGMTVQPGLALTIQPARIVVDFVNFLTHAGVALSPSQVPVVTGQRAALSTALPATAGQEWLNGGVLCVS